MPSKPSAVRQVLDAAKGRVEALADPDDDTTDLSEVDTTRPLAAKQAAPHEHGHIDRPRGLHDFHDHENGHTEHGHKRGQLLDRTASIDEYVPPLAATTPPGADQETDPTPAGAPSASGDSRGTAGSGRSTALVVADAAALQDLGNRMEATERKIRGRLAEFNTVASLAVLVDAALKQLDYDDLVSPTVVVQLKDTINGWADGRGVNGS